MEATQGLKTVNQIVSEQQVNPGQVSQWKKQLQSEGATIFKSKTKGNQGQQEKKEAELYEQKRQLVEQSMTPKMGAIL